MRQCRDSGSSVADERETLVLVPFGGPFLILFLYDTYRRDRGTLFVLFDSQGPLVSRALRALSSYGYRSDRQTGIVSLLYFSKAEEAKREGRFHKVLPETYRMLTALREGLRPSLVASARSAARVAPVGASGGQQHPHCAAPLFFGSARHLAFPRYAAQAKNFGPVPVFTPTTADSRSNCYYGFFAICKPVTGVLGFCAAGGSFGKKRAGESRFRVKNFGRFPALFCPPQGPVPPLWYPKHRVARSPTGGETRTHNGENGK